VESKLQPVDLNRIVEDVRLLLERTIPKMIKIELHLTGNLRHVNADASQVEQVLMNLAVNARDAMPKGGTLRIETTNITVDKEFRRSRPELTSGNYVLLAVIDTGQGMARPPWENIFDPRSSTTKEVGKGTGWALPWFTVLSEPPGAYRMPSASPGEGTTFEDLPPCRGAFGKSCNNITEQTCYAVAMKPYYSWTTMIPFVTLETDSSNVRVHCDVRPGWRKRPASLPRVQRPN